MRRVLVILLAVSAVFSASPMEGARRNVVLVVGDDHERDAGCYGNPVIQTPNLDRLASDGTRFGEDREPSRRTSVVRRLSPSLLWRFCGARVCMHGKTG